MGKKREARNDGDEKKRAVRQEDDRSESSWRSLKKRAVTGWSRGNDEQSRRSDKRKEREKQCTSVPSFSMMGRYMREEGCSH